MRPPGANGNVDDGDVTVSSATVGGETIKTYKIAVGKDYLAPKLVNGHLYITTIKVASDVEAATDSLAAATVGGDGEEE